MGNRAADIMERQADNLRHALKHASQEEKGGLTYALLLVENVAVALEMSAKEEREAGKWWYREEQARQERRRQQERIITEPRQEKWF